MNTAASAGAGADRTAATERGRASETERELRAGPLLRTTATLTSSQGSQRPGQVRRMRGMMRPRG